MRQKLLFVLLFFVISCQKEGIYNLSEERQITFEELISKIKKHDIIFVGELHDVKEHHQRQLSIIKALNETGEDVAVGVEMLLAEDQPLIDRWLRGEVPDEEFIRLYYERWRMPWSLYSAIFSYAKEEGIPVVGLNIPKEITSQVAREGFSSLTPEQRKRIPASSCPVDEQYIEFIKKALKVHSTGRDLRYFCEAQKLWDISMAYYIVKFLRMNPKYRMVVITGGGHAWKPGIPEEVRKTSGFSYTVILNCLKKDCNDITREEADFLWF